MKTRAEPRRAAASSTAFTVLVCAFVLVTVISNICATKGVVLFPGMDFEFGPIRVQGLVTDGAFWLFPLAYVLGDVISEVYGFRVMRRVVVVGFAAMVLVAGAFWVTIALPSADFYANQQALEATVGVVPAIFLASLAGFVVGELVNSLVLVRLKARTGEKLLGMRLIGSTLAGGFMDTLLFCLIAAPVIGIATGSDLVNYVVVGFVWKTLIEVLVLPVTYRAIALLKRHEPTYWGADVP